MKALIWYGASLSFSIKINHLSGGADSTVTTQVQENLISSSPGLSSLRLHLVDPTLVDVHRVGLDVQRLVVHDLLDDRCQDLPQRVLSPRTSVEAHHHLDDCRVSRDDLLHLVHF